MVLTKILESKNISTAVDRKPGVEYFEKAENALNYAKNKSQIKYIHKIQNKSQAKNVTQNLVNYILNIQMSTTNTLISLADTRGKPIISLSGGSINLKKRQKKLQPLALINILKFLLLKAKFLHGKTVAVHFKNIKVYYESLVIKVLRKVIFIKSIKSYNLQPHNGCRPKKIKRFKRRTKKS